MPRLLIALGSNLADPEAAVRLAWRAVCDGLDLAAPRLAAPVASRPAEGARGAVFVNTVGVGETARPPLEVLGVLERIELAFGRQRACEVLDRARPLDLDLLDWGGVRLDAPRLSLPHPRLHERDFVLVPLARVAPDFVDARTGRSVAELIAALTTRWITPGADPLCGN